MNSILKFSFSIYIVSFLSLGLAQMNIRPLTNSEITEHSKIVQQLQTQQNLEIEQLRQNLGQPIELRLQSQLGQEQIEQRQEIGQATQAPTVTSQIQPIPPSSTPIETAQPIRTIVPPVIPITSTPLRTIVPPTTSPTINPTANQSLNLNQDLSKPEQIALIKSLKQNLRTSAWPPNVNSTWQVQLFLDQYNPINTSIPADIYDIEVDAPQAVINQLQQQGHKVICYLNAGTAESFRPSTQTAFRGDLSRDTELLEQWRSQGVLGNVYGERFSNEFWMNPKNRYVRSYVQSLLNKCKTKGFDGVSFDNLDGFSFDRWNAEPEQTGFNLTEADQLEYNLWLVEEAHKRGLFAGLKNTGEIAEPLSQVYDWVFVESCYSERIQGWDPACENYARYFATKGKAIYLNEYDWNMQNLADEKNISLQELRRQYCAWAEEDGIFLMFREDDTKANRLLCSDIR